MASEVRAGVGSLSGLTHGMQRRLISSLCCRGGSDCANSVEALGPAVVEIVWTTLRWSPSLQVHPSRGQL